jgi:hypothetical protein
MGKKYITATEASNKYFVSTSMIRKLIGEKKVEAKKTEYGPGVWLVNENDIAKKYPKRDEK